MKRLFSVLAVALFVCISAVGQNYCDPYLISVNLDSVRLAKVSDEKYLEDLTSMERSVKQNLTNLQSCIKEMEGSIKKIKDQGKLQSKEVSYLKKELGLLDKQKKSRDGERKSINKEIKAINKDKELTASDKNERMARYYQRIESLDKEDATYERRKSDIANKQESLNETMSGSEGEITNLEKRISELESKRESYKILQSRIKNEEKLVKSQMVK